MRKSKNGNKQERRGDSRVTDKALGRKEKKIERSGSERFW